MKGRLGNQLFKYAFTRYVHIKRAEADDLVFSFNNMIGRDSSDGWEDSLKYFNTINYSIYDGKGHLVTHKTTFIQRLIVLLYYFETRVIGRNDRGNRNNITYKWDPLLNKLGLLIIGEKLYIPFIPNSKNIFIDGSFQCTKYFDEIRNVLLNEFTPKEAPLIQNSDLYRIIEGSNSVCISIRRGDYVSNAEFNKIYNLCDIQYFTAAVQKIKEVIDNPVFILFSDDIDWARNNLDFGVETYYESGNDPVWEKLRLMYSCKHFIISNSSFSWWAQYLCRNDSKIVVSPSRWYNLDYPAYLIDDKWITIEV